MLNYLGPINVLVNQPVALIGTFDSEKIQTVSVIAEDKYPLTVRLNSKSGIWHVSLEKGFNTQGQRWLRLKGFDRQNKSVSDEVIRLTVALEGNFGSETLLIARYTTPFKKQAISSSRLTPQQQQNINVGEVLPLKDYKLVNNHLEVELKNPLGGVGKFGYFYEEHVLLIKNGKILWFDREDLPPTPSGTQLLWITQTTSAKLKPQDSAQLGMNQTLELTHGSTYTILGYACVEDHFRVTFDRSIPGFGQYGYIYRYHAELWEQDQAITYNTNAINLTVINTTVFKKRPVDAAYLSEKDQVTISAGMVYGVQSYTTEDGHLKVALTENLPGFGNTGYVYPDFIQLSRADQPIIPKLPVTYEGPSEVLVNQSTILNGTFDPRVVTAITLMAEDRYGLDVVLNSTAKTWEVKLAKGFSEAGYRWLRLKATNSKKELVASHVINLTVSSSPLTVGEGLTLTITNDTLFKVAPFDSTSLNQLQKVAIKAGQKFKVLKYGWVDGHLKVLLNNAIPPIGSFGYFFQSHVQLSKGSEVLQFEIDSVPDTDVNAQMLVIKTTTIKAKPIDSFDLSPDQFTPLLLGETYPIKGYASTQGHFRVTLAESVEGFGNVGYIYWQHVRLLRDGQEIPFDPDSLTMTIGQTTVLKKRPIDASRLAASERATLPLGRVYGVRSYAIADNHIRVALTEELPDFGNTGYVFPDFVKFQRGGKIFDPLPDQIELNVPYFSQRDNPRYSWSTCNVTSIAMVLYYYGLRSQYGGQLEDELLQWCFNYAGVGSQTEHNVLTALIRAYGYKSSFSTTRRWSEIKEELINRRPVVIGADLTPAGHVLTIIGYNKKGYIVNDPWGDAYTGYNNTEGRRLLYSYGYFNQVAGPDGNVWAHFIDP
ncbi:peptidase C39 like family protein [Lyngbya aestuarii BL J]|uniref:Peptidase C39 like family protein n=1 Tax=Lyngbya aestuarii BL J TaxID=1348334 RepID=U7QG66_9CYAN|nr:C39 family peptidase [Lyngbya aestuarii]ERT05411.1 peptidase C39 like family protein [Lyngbya aestuarii BL J]